MDAAIRLMLLTNWPVSQYPSIQWQKENTYGRIHFSKAREITNLTLNMLPHICPRITESIRFCG